MQGEKELLQIECRPEAKNIISGFATACNAFLDIWDFVKESFEKLVEALEQSKQEVLKESQKKYADRFWQFKQIPPKKIGNINYIIDHPMSKVWRTHRARGNC